MRTFWVHGLVVVFLVSGCKPGERQRPPAPWQAAAVAHAGVGSPPERSGICRDAVDAALDTLEAGGDALDAVVAGIEVLEDDPDTNAGTGSRVRIDGETVQMDASLMHGDGRFGAVAVIERVQHPIDVARKVMDSPHLVLAGDGAERFARAHGIPEYEPATEERKKQADDLRKLLLEKDARLGEWATYDWRQAWNFEKSLAELGIDVGTDTVGVVVRTEDGAFAAGLSTGGTSITLRGRVGDVPVYGAGMFAGPWGAVAATGKGERIIEEMIGRTTHAQLAEGKSAEAAAAHAVERVRGRGSIGLIVISPDGIASAADRDMAWAGRVAGSDTWLGPEPAADDGD